MDHARNLLRNMEQLAATAAQMQAGVETSVSICVDVLFPPVVIAGMLSAFEERYPRVPIIISTGVWRAPVRALADGTMDLAVAPPIVGGQMRMAEVAEVQFVPVVAPGHPLTQLPTPIPRDILLTHRRLILQSDAKLPEESDGRGSLWQLDDAATRRGLLLSGVGWARLAHWHVSDDLRAGRLVALDIDGWTGPDRVSLAVMMHPDRGQGPATRWLFDFLATRSKDRAASHQDS
ncbi:MAG: substrate-binding domain-containing protein [Myxococcales bacterium]|nr:substrate-binding domain-containing protein [Myxococcales bacterium]